MPYETTQTARWLEITGGRWAAQDQAARAAVTHLLSAGCEGTPADASTVSKAVTTVIASTGADQG